MMVLVAGCDILVQPKNTNWFTRGWPGLSGLFNHPDPDVRKFAVLLLKQDYGNHKAWSGSLDFAKDSRILML